MAAVLASGPEALLSHRSAAALWGLRGYWPGTGQIVELDGWEGHRTKSAFEDRARARKLKVPATPSPASPGTS
jgi:hypothetical protein